MPDRRTATSLCHSLFVCAVCVAAAILSGARGARAEALLLVDVDSGKVLHAENATQPWYPASVTKLMTAYVTLRAVKEGRITLDSLINVSDNAVAQQPGALWRRDRCRRASSVGSAQAQQRARQAAPRAARG